MRTDFRAPRAPWAAISADEDTPPPPEPKGGRDGEVKVPKK